MSGSVVVEKDRSLFPVLILVAAVFLAYIPLLDNGFVNWDDPETILDNPHIRSLGPGAIKWMFTTPLAGYWIPLTWFSLAVDFAVGGVNPRVYHLTNLILHLLNTAIVFWVCRKLLKLVRREEKGIGSDHFSFAGSGAFLAALLFGLHPLHVESVAWATERKDVLYSFFYLLSLYYYLEHASLGQKWSRPLWISLFFFVLSIMSKPMAVTLPLVLLVLDRWPLRRIAGGVSHLLAEKAPFFLVALLAGIPTLLFHPENIALTERFSVGFRTLNAFRALVFYPWKMILPFDLSPFYPIPRMRDGSCFLWDCSALVLVLLFSFFAVRWRKTSPSLLTAWLFYLVTLSPVLGFPQVGVQAAADRYTYLASLGIFLPVAAGICRYTASRKERYIFVCLLLSVPLGFGASRQIGVWRDSQDLWERVVKIYPGESQIAHKNLAMAYQTAGRTLDALGEYDKANLIPPPMASAHNGRGTVLFDLGKREEAVQEMRIAVQLDPRAPSPHRNLAICYEKMGRHEEALAEMREYERLLPEDAGGKK